MVFPNQLWTPEPENVYVNFYLFIYFWPHCMACRILVPQLGIESKSPAVQAPRPNHRNRQGRPCMCVLISRKRNPISFPSFSECLLSSYGSQILQRIAYAVFMKEKLLFDDCDSFWPLLVTMSLLPSDMSLWHKDYFRLFALEKEENKRSRWEKNSESQVEVSYHFVRAIYTYRGNIYV